MLNAEDYNEENDTHKLCYTLSLSLSHTHTHTHTHSRQHEAAAVAAVRGHEGSCKNKYRAVLWDESETSPL